MLVEKLVRLVGFRRYFWTSKISEFSKIVFEQIVNFESWTFGFRWASLEDANLFLCGIQFSNLPFEFKREIQIENLNWNSHGSNFLDVRKDWEISLKTKESSTTELHLRKIASNSQTVNKPA